MQLSQVSQLSVQLHQDHLVGEDGAGQGEQQASRHVEHVAARERHLLGRDLHQEPIHLRQSQSPVLCWLGFGSINRQNAPDMRAKTFQQRKYSD